MRHNFFLLVCTVLTLFFGCQGDVITKIMTHLASQKEPLILSGYVYSSGSDPFRTLSFRFNDPKNRIKDDLTVLLDSNDPLVLKKLAKLQYKPIKLEGKIKKKFLKLAHKNEGLNSYSFYIKKIHANVEF